MPEPPPFQEKAIASNVLVNGWCASPAAAHLPARRLSPLGLTMIREVSPFVRSDDPPDHGTGFTGSWASCAAPLVPGELSREEGRRFFQACGELPPDRRSPIRFACAGSA
jgi:hypothetical protein